MNFFSPEVLSNLGVTTWGYTSNLNSASFDNYKNWLALGRQANMAYLTGERAEKRSSLNSFWPKAKGALVFLFSYAEAKREWDQKNHEAKHRVAGYAVGFQGEDYHLVLDEKLQALLKIVQDKIPNIEGKIILDTSAVLERDLAYRAGLGWFGKNSMLIHREYGSLFIIGSILLSQNLQLLELPLETDHCGVCRKCVDACPTNAIDEHSRTLKSEKCISYYTIELFKDVPPLENHQKSRGEIFGCDICQEVCPWVNRHAKSGIELKISKENRDSGNYSKLEFLSWLVNLSSLDFKKYLESLSLKMFKNIFKNTALVRTGKKGLIKNLRSLIEK